MGAGRLAVLAAVLMAATARAQVPSTVSPRLARAWARADTTVLVWVIARRGADLDSVAARVRRAGGLVRRRSRFVWAVSAQVPGGAIRVLAADPDVRRVQALGAYFRRPAPRAPAFGPTTPGAAICAAARCPPPRAGLILQDTTYGPGAWAVDQLDIPAVHRLGLRGAGVRIAILDAGFNTAHPYMSGADVVAQYDFVNNDSIVADQPGDVPQGEMAHGTATWSLLAADRPGRLVGVAPDAQYLLAKTEYTATETRTEEDNWVAAVEWAESLGVNVISSSLGYLSFDNGFTYTAQQLNGDVGVTSIAADSAAARGTLVAVSIGNTGPLLGTLDTPADAHGIIAVGATDSLGNVAAFSSRGPTADGRIKPELVAPGVGVRVASISGGDMVESGTSFATPLVAGIAALVAGTRVGQPASDVRRGLLAAGSTRYAPDNVHGYGIPDALNALAFPTGFEAVGPLDSLTSVTPTFAWGAGTPPPASPPDTVQLLVAVDSAFATVALDTTVTSAAVTLPHPAPPGTRLYWQATARSALGGTEATPRIGPLTVPPWVTLLSLNAPSGESIRDSLPLFVWRSPTIAPPSGPFTYDVAVYPASEGPDRPVASARQLRDTTFRPSAPLERNLPFRWRVVAHAGPSDSAVTASTGTFVVLDERAPSTTLLFQNFPNPFPNRGLGVNATCIWFDIAQPGDVSLQIYDLRGRLIRRLVPSDLVPGQLDAGRYGRPAGAALGTCDPRFTWDGKDQTGAYVRAGVYLYRLTAPGFRDTKRIVFLGAP